MELFLAKLLGLYFLIVGVIVLVRRDSVMPTIASMARERALLFAVATIEVVAGLALVIAYPVVSLTLPGILSLVGYMMVVEAVIYLAAPARFIRGMIAAFNRPVWYIIGGLLSVLAGIFLAGRGFGYF